MNAPPKDVPLGLYLHIPFCRKRCKFCYFRVYTDKNSSEVEQYVAALAREIELVSRLQVMGGRPFRFVYFGGGTPSFLSAKQLTSLVDRLRANINWDQAEEVTFECEPGTLSERKVHTLRELGVTRISLGVENFSDAILEENGRAHLSAEIDRSWRWILDAGFANTNIDLIAGMVGENWDNWRETVRRTIEYSPDSVTIYQMELPFNTTISKDLLKGTRIFEEPIVNWSTKRRWVAEAFEALERAGYHVRSAYTAVRNPSRTKFIYTDRLWQGADMVGLGVASFGHVNGVNMQNADTGESYSESVVRDEIPLRRAYRPTPDERFIREMVLQLKLGSVRPQYFRDKYGVDILQRFAAELDGLRNEGYLSEASEQRVALTRNGLLCVDVLLPRFFLPQHTGIRYT
jgi:oxygen-independent coproporphyrinogen-3 oxidase